MSRGLIIVESPAKIRTIREIVGRRFDIRATIGHIKDIPRDSLGVDVENNFRMTFVNIKGKSRAVHEIRTAAAKADRVYLATDPDREGEAISWHVSQLVPATTSVERITFNAITRSEIEHALQHPTEINQKLVDSQFARRIIDRLIGYLLSPESSRHLGGKFSVGRVQSPALALIVEREREIRAFTSEPYWLIKVVYAKDGTEFNAALKQGRLTDEDETARTVDAIRNAQRHEIVDVETGEVSKNPPPPFITSTFQRAAFKAYRMNSNRAMRIAQDLYEGQEIAGRQIALITYMRTDSPRLSGEGMESAREQVVAQFGQQYHQRRNFRSKAGTQDAHEAIRPAHPEITPEMAKQYLERPHLQIYSLIYKRWLASQMKPALYNRVKVRINADEVELETVGTTLVFEGFLRVYGKDLNEQEKDEEGAEGKLPPLAVGDTPALISAESEKKMTQPPPRYNNGSLVEKLENLGIGRPSTYASIVQLIQDREYVEEGNRREFMPTARGEKLFDYLKEHRPVVVDYAFTAQMESELDEVEEGKKPYLDVVNDEFEKVKDAYELYRKGDGFHMHHKPTRKQLDLARRLAQVAEEEIPEETLADSKKLSDWIDSIKSRVDLPTLPPSEKQLSYAEALARDTDMELTDELRSDAQKISKFIDQARKILDRKIAANKRELTVNYMNDDGLETEYEKTTVIDIIDQEEKKAIGLRLGLRQTKWIPRSQIVRLTDSVLTMKNKWAVDNVYAAKGRGRGAKKTAKKTAKKSAKKGAKKSTRKRASKKKS